jgi:hypothetical protein
MQQCNYMLIGCSVLRMMLSVDALSSATAAPVQIGLPHCNTTCGDVRVPYPFGFGPSNCYWPGMKLTCDTSRNPPRLLLGTLQVLDISLPDSTVRVIRHTMKQTMTVHWSDKYGRSAGFLLSDIGGHMVSSRNELIFFGCGEAILYSEPRNGRNITDSIIISRCFTNCSSEVPVPRQTHGRYDCSGRYACCHAPIPSGSIPNIVNILKIDTKPGYWPAALISEEGLIDELYATLDITNDLVFANKNYMLTSPLVLLWAVKQGLSATDDNSGQCSGDVANGLCKSKDSYCRQANGGFTCYCSSGYQGNPYIADGCQGHL